tara:strand:+ start:608 stop:1999 length:1392 start_codon:yes stop_codon:yes gene_type:complete
MLFNSIDFAIFLPIVFLLYWFVAQKNLRLQNSVIVVASYIFYGWWDWRFLSLITFSTVVDYLVGKKLGTEDKQLKRKVLLCTSIIVNVGLLGFFKYYNFFIENFAHAFSLFGMQNNISRLNIILPVGISFYTFQTLSYTLDVFKKKIQPTKDFIAFSAFVCFFPQLVAGPIEKAKILLPQMLSKRYFSFSQSKKGLFLIVYGLFKKLVIADNLAIIVDPYFSDITTNATNFNFTLLAVFFYSIQIYCDFSGYSDIAIGVSKQFGVNLSVNFNRPYFSTNPVKFWRRWHISLSTWFRDYVFIPLGGSRVNSFFTIRNIFIVFILSGLWHGADWTFIIWGVGHFIFYLCYFILNKYYNFNCNKYLSIFSTFIIVSLLWIPFRTANISETIMIVKGLLYFKLISVPLGLFVQLKMFMILVIFFSYELILELTEEKNLTNYFSFIFLTMTILFFGNFSNNSFVYFQF